MSMETASDARNIGLDPSSTARNGQMNITSILGQSHESPRIRNPSNDEKPIEEQKVSEKVELNQLSRHRMQCKMDEDRTQSRPQFAEQQVMSHYAANNQHPLFGSNDSLHYDGPCSPHRPRFPVQQQS